MNLTYQGESHERSGKGSVCRKIYTGSKEELKEYLSSLEIGSGESESETVSSAVLSQKEGPLWQLEVTHTILESSGSYFSRKPNTAYGERSAKLECSCVSVPIETLPSYRKHWDHYLLIGELADPSGTLYTEHSTEVLPPFWETADASFLMPTEFINMFRWVRDPRECPVYVGNDRRKWRIFCNPTKPGAVYVDKAVYRITESVRCRTSKQAGEFAGNVINKITVPFERFGIKHSENCWKCDSASIHWNGNDWIATMIYTMSPDPMGWDKDFYEKA